jgi:hypothetical protein
VDARVLLEHAVAPEVDRAQFSAVWPPMVGRIASGRSLAMIAFSTVCQVMGSM